MKKIVALVLALVMVLGLATTAFAATTSTGSVSTTTITPVKAGWYTLATAGNSMTESNVTVTTIEKTTVTGMIDDDVPMYVPNIYELNETNAFYAEVAKADAKYALKNNGEYIYVYPITGANTLTAAIDAVATDVVMDTIVLPADEDVDCGDCTLGNDVVPYYVSGDDVYYALDTTQGAATKFAYFNGQFVAYSAVNANTFVKHTWDYTSVIVKDTDTKGVKVPVSIECSECEKTFSVVGITKFDNTWKLDVNYADFDETKNNAVYGAGPYFIVLDGATDANTQAPAADATDKVESAETFDAGIAMYVGMSVMAAAGSAVVLKKKD